jgi:hypothetical protein
VSANGPQVVFVLVAFRTSCSFDHSRAPINLDAQGMDKENGECFTDSIVVEGLSSVNEQCAQSKRKKNRNLNRADGATT